MYLSTAAGLGPRRSEAILTPYSPTPSVPVPPLRRDLQRSLPADAGRQLLPSVAYNGHHAPVSGKGDAAESLAAVRQRARRARCVPGSSVEKFPGTYDGLHPIFSRGKHFVPPLGEGCVAHAPGATPIP